MQSQQLTSGLLELFLKYFILTFPPKFLPVDVIVIAAAVVVVVVDGGVVESGLSIIYTLIDNVIFQNHLRSH